eukprot:CAMPEP_0119473368 /NCGR_PEP_ID=MMETSP1344-20130328/5056_1 /TAXON_ID=236787 /ORGANISM="Florenciella parvula, Strain CCMP2471" /LENGTH=276 /DNA_ID=CAMNT_0007506473 /DNA_START=61 /DNA_END=892 /DNA_ORIENTATION=-
MAASMAAMSASASGAAMDGEWDEAAGVWRGNRAVDAGVEVPDPLVIFGYGERGRSTAATAAASVTRHPPAYNAPCSFFLSGPGSLCWRPEPSFGEGASYPCRVSGWGRFFAQRSTDHRGTPKSPGLVATMLSDAQLEAIGLREAGVPPSSTIGMGYEIATESAEGVLADLDFREKGGYTREVVLVQPLAGGEPVKALLYSATPDNPNFDKTMLDPDAVEMIRSFVDDLRFTSPPPPARTPTPSGGHPGRDRDRQCRWSEWLECRVPLKSDGLVALT